MHTEQNDQKGKKKQETGEEVLSFKYSVDLNVLHFSSKVCSSDQA